MKTTAEPNAGLPLIARLLLSKGSLDQEKLSSARDAQLKDRVPLEEILVRKGFASEKEIAAAYADYYLMPLLGSNGGDVPADPELAKHLPEKLCRDHLIAPVAVHDRTMDVAFFTPDELLIVEELQLITGLEIRPMVAPLSVVEGILGAIYDESAWPGANATAGSGDFEQMAGDDDADAGGDGLSEEVVHLDQPPPPGRDGRIIRFVNQILEHAFHMGASDVHFEPFEDEFRVRLRVDGSLHEIAPPPLSMFTPIV